MNQPSLKYSDYFQFNVFMAACQSFDRKLTGTSSEKQAMLRI